jgi:homoserine dehydrogenase
VRLVAGATLSGDSVTASVVPVVLGEQHPLARVPDAFNEILIEGEGFRHLTLRGPGAGGSETATAVLGDILTITRASRR